MTGPGSQKNQRLRICQLNTVFNGGGTDNQTLGLCTALRTLGHDVVLALAAGCNWEPVARSADVTVALLPSTGLRKTLRIPALARQLRLQRADIVHAHQGRDYWPAILAARLAGARTRVIVTRHLMTRPAAMSRRFLLRCAHAVAVSQAVLGVLRRELCGPPERLHRIYCGIDTSKFESSRSASGQALRTEQGWDNGTVVFGIIGRYRLPRGKGHLEFLEAAAQIKSRFPHARFAVIGRGSMGPLLREHIGALGIASEVAMLPFTPEMPRVINALDVVVHPATGTDAFPLVVLEGMACGKPVIASRLDGIPEQLQDGSQGLLVPPGDVGALVQAMSELLLNPARCAEMGAAGRERVCAHFTSSEQAGHYQALYTRLCTGSGRTC